jgi:hypothetical protein
MKKVQFSGQHYHAAHHGFVWVAGDIREMDDAEAARLVETFPGKFGYVAESEPAKAKGEATGAKAPIDAEAKAAAEARAPKASKKGE